MSRLGKNAIVGKLFPRELARIELTKSFVVLFWKEHNFSAQNTRFDLLKAINLNKIEDCHSLRNVCIASKLHLPKIQTSFLSSSHLL